MKRLIIFLSITLLSFSCGKVDRGVTHAETNKIRVIPLRDGMFAYILAIDSCEYVVGTVYAGMAMSHKGNCKYCAERRRVEALK